MVVVICGSRRRKGKGMIIVKDEKDEVLGGWAQMCCSHSRSGARAVRLHMDHPHCTTLSHSVLCSTSVQTLPAEVSAQLFTTGNSGLKG